MAQLTPTRLAELLASAQAWLDDRTEAPGEDEPPEAPGLLALGPSPEQQFRRGLIPPIPGPGVDPRLAAIWRTLRARPRHYGRIEVNPFVLHRRRSEVPGASNTGATAGIGATMWETSLNWSGAVLTARDDERFSAVTGRWRVPDAVPAGPEAPPPIEGPNEEPPSRRCSVWVGLDGHRAFSDSLPQVGTTTAEIFDNGQRRVETYAWAQWWVRGKEYGEARFVDLPVRPGDEVMCWLALHEPGRVVLRIRNITQGVEDARIWRSGPARQRREEQAHEEAAPVPGLAAVWVVERPMVPGATDLYPLPNFGQVEFRDCIAAVRRAEDPYHLAHDLRGLGGRRLIRMFDQQPEPWRSRRISLPDPPGAERERLTVRYRG